MKKLSIVLVAILALTACKKNPDEVAKISDEKKLEIQNCIDEISKKAFVFNGNDASKTIVIAVNKKIYMLTPDEATAVSKNWDYNNLRLYTNSDNNVYNYELDACRALKKLDALIATKTTELARHDEVPANPVK